MCTIRELVIPAAAWPVPPGFPPVQGTTVHVLGQACQGHLFAAPMGSPDDVRGPAWIDLGPQDDLPRPGRPVSAAVWRAWREAVGLV